MNQFLRPLLMPLVITLCACASNEPAATATATTTPPGFVVGSITHETSNGTYRLGIVGKPGQRIQAPREALNNALHSGRLAVAVL
jgi:hypothetical protein